MFISGLSALTVAAAQQSAPATTPTDIPAADAEGARFPHGDAVTIQPPFGAPMAVGSDARKCVAVAAGRTAASGDFEAGPFDLFGQRWQRGHTKLWWAPRFLMSNALGDQGENGLLVRGRRLDAPDVQTAYSYAHLVRGIPNGLVFFNSDFWLPSAGRWMLVATYGPNWGCFVVDAK